jgi:hypothetical protein
LAVAAALGWSHRGDEFLCRRPASHDGITIPLFDQFVRTIHFVH